jgi:hypothetical protein
MNKHDLYDALLATALVAAVIGAIALAGRIFP